MAEIGSDPRNKFVRTFGSVDESEERYYACVKNKCYDSPCPAHSVGSAVEVHSDSSGWMQGQVVNSVDLGLITVEFAHNGLLHRKSVSAESGRLHSVSKCTCNSVREPLLAEADPGFLRVSRAEFDRGFEETWICTEGDRVVVDGRAGKVMWDGAGTGDARVMWQDDGTENLIKKNKIIAPAFKDTFTVGQRVWRRDMGGDWGAGFVTSVYPMKVTANTENPAAHGCSWDHVRPVTGGEDQRRGTSTRGTSASGTWSTGSGSSIGSSSRSASLSTGYHRQSGRGAVYSSFGGHQRGTSSCGTSSFGTLSTARGSSMDPSSRSASLSAGYHRQSGREAVYLSLGGHQYACGDMSSGDSRSLASSSGSSSIGHRRGKSFYANSISGSFSSRSSYCSS